MFKAFVLLFWSGLFFANTASCFASIGKSEAGWAVASALAAVLSLGIFFVEARR